MSVEIAKKAIRDFLLSKEPEVLCIKGAWGTGKTFAFNEVLAGVAGKIPLKSYSYVSLFGLNSLDAVKRAIFENSVDTKSIGVEPSLETFKKNALDITETIGRKYYSFWRQLPYANTLAGSFDALAFFSLRDQIICIDDLERRGNELQVRDVLGLISFLKEQRRCKIVLILNQGELNDNDFAKYYEKVIDAEIEFAPTPEECARIAFDCEDNLLEHLRRQCIALGVSNIRVMKQIERLAKIAAPLLVSFDQSIAEQTAQTLTLLGWSKHTKDAPPISFIQHKYAKGMYGLSKSGDFTEQEKGWDALLQKVGFTGMDELDLKLLEGTERGYFDDAGLVQAAKKLDDQKKALDLEGSFTAAWRLYHDTFDNNQEKLITTMVGSFAKAIPYISPINLDGTVRLFKELGEQDKAKKLISDYVAARKEERALFDLDKYPFAGDVTDPDVRDAFAKEAEKVVDNRNPIDVLYKMAKNSGWNSEDITLLSKIPIDGYVELFKKAGDRASVIIGACLLFNNLGGADEKMKTIGSNAAEALKKIGSESALNSRRVKRYGIDI